jgi:hypothetical protein
MRERNDTQPRIVGAQIPRSIRYEDWRIQIQIASDLDQLVGTVRAYLAEWTPDELAALPAEIAFTLLRSSEEIPSRAVIAARAELKAKTDDPATLLLREMALTMMAAASRLRFLGALRVRESRRSPLA